MRFSFYLALFSLGLAFPACVFLIPGGQHSLIPQKVEVEEKLLVEAPPAALPEGQPVSVINSSQQLPPGLLRRRGRHRLRPGGRVPGGGEGPPRSSGDLRARGQGHQ